MGVVDPPLRSLGSPFPHNDGKTLAAPPPLQIQQRLLSTTPSTWTAGPRVLRLLAAASNLHFPPPISLNTNTTDLCSTSRAAATIPPDSGGTLAAFQTVHMLAAVPLPPLPSLSPSTLPSAMNYTSRTVPVGVLKAPFPAQDVPPPLPSSDDFRQNFPWFKRSGDDCHCRITTTGNCGCRQYGFQWFPGLTIVVSTHLARRCAFRGDAELLQGFKYLWLLPPP
ncbi:uncharacterized protein ARMOST_07674 [Armillaria ostoyae]|uniref:Uncharacterized protein n=1 Tax=Armillaria ostoyae TaxID=47428 RepID=A0A284R6F9_ARMOS|nr:uncharacterized protein ARMOST_07674 [Armillaria ostoyae]